MKFYFKSIILSAVLWMAFAIPAKAQFDVYGQTTPTLLAARSISNALTTLPSSANAVDLKNYVGQPALILAASTNSVGQFIVKVVTTNSIYGTFYTNTFAAVNGTTNALQTIPFDTLSNGRYAIVMCDATNQAAFNVSILGRMKDQ